MCAMAFLSVCSIFWSLSGGTPDMFLSLFQGCHWKADSAVLPTNPFLSGFSTSYNLGLPYSPEVSRTTNCSVMLFSPLPAFLESLVLFFLIVALSRMLLLPSSSSLPSSGPFGCSFLYPNCFIPRPHCVYLVATFLLDFLRGGTLLSTVSGHRPG